MKKGLVVIFIIMIVGLIGLIIFKEGSLPVNKKDSSSKIFIIREGESLNTITRDLAQQGLIRNRIVFYVIVKEKGYDKKIQAGDFRLSSSMDAYQLAKSLTHGTLDVWVTIIEGL